ncbi:hypothetical protein RGZ1_259 [Morganella phage vB_MmoM_Rgz1]|nr:hypothetical protein RGZ1_259 [Morganella phage vB_MmoM_Rgz1]
MATGDFSVINTNLIISALEYYKDNFKPISVPTYISEKHNRKTAGTCKLLKHGDLTYVGSAEQSFIQMYEEGLLKDGAYCAITPCHRDEVLDETHLELFLKLELIVIGKNETNDVLGEALRFFSQECGNSFIEIEPSGNRNDEMDIIINGIEVGSYGSDIMSDGKIYTYGTGLAEPRFSYAITKGN